VFDVPSKKKAPCWLCDGDRWVDNSDGEGFIPLRSDDPWTDRDFNPELNIHPCPVCNADGKENCEEPPKLTIAICDCHKKKR